MGHIQQEIGLGLIRIIGCLHQRLNPLHLLIFIHHIGQQKGISHQHFILIDPVHMDIKHPLIIVKFVGNTGTKIRNQTRLRQQIADLAIPKRRENFLGMHICLHKSVIAIHNNDGFSHVGKDILMSHLRNIKHILENRRQEKDHNADGAKRRQRFKSHPDSGDMCHHT